DFIADSFDGPAPRLVGGGTPHNRTQRPPNPNNREAPPPRGRGRRRRPRPPQPARGPPPPGVRGWGRPNRDQLRRWQHLCAIRLQPDTLSYAANFLDLDPRHRDRSGLGLPLVRITYDIQDNERRLDQWMEAKAGEILRAMGATQVWRGLRLGGVCSSHDLGGTRM